MGLCPDDKTIINEAIETYGRNVQTIVAIEELSELQKELTKYLRSNGDKQHLEEEIADVEIMLEQIKIMYNASDTAIENFHNSKMIRLWDRLGNIVNPDVTMNEEILEEIRMK